MKIEIKSNEDMARLKQAEDMGIDTNGKDFLAGYLYGKIKATDQMLDLLSKGVK